MTQKELIQKIAERLIGISCHDLTKAERQIFRLLQTAGYLTYDDSDDDLEITVAEKGSKE